MLYAIILAVTATVLVATVIRHNSYVKGFQHALSAAHVERLSKKLHWPKYTWFEVGIFYLGWAAGYTALHRNLFELITQIILGSIFMVVGVFMWRRLTQVEAVARQRLGIGFGQ